MKLPRASFKRKTSENSSFKTIKAEDDTALAIPSSYSGDVDQLDDMVKSMMEKVKASMPMDIGKLIDAKCVKGGQRKLYQIPH